MKKLLLLCAALFAVADPQIVSAAPIVDAPPTAQTSYLLIQGPFGAGGAVETFQWKVLYAPGELSTGFDLLKTVLGTPVRNGDYHDGFGSTLNYYTAGTATQGAGYIQFSGGSFFTESFTLNSIKVAMDSDYEPAWNYYVAGGSGSQHGGSYPAGSWSYSADGMETRQLSNGSYDGWVFGSTGTYDPSTFQQLTPPDTIAGSQNAPTTANFANATVVPEPSSALFLASGAAWLLGLRGSRKKRLG